MQMMLRPVRSRGLEELKRRESRMANLRYIIYINDPNNKSVGHVEQCPHAKIWGGETTAAGGWLGPFGSREAVETLGQLSGNPFHWCGHCSR
jgi:hypothetical protein